MLIRLLAAAALATLSFGAAQAGTLQGGVWTPKCTMPGDAPHFSSKSPDAYNKSAKDAQAWQQSVKDYVDCQSAEAKADQNAIVSTANGNVGKLSDQMNALNAELTAAVDVLKKKGGSAPH